MSILASLQPRSGAAASRPTLNAEAYRLLEEMIVTLELAPGSIVSEAVLSGRLGIGMTPVREALQRLSREYLVRILPRRGVVITAIDVVLQMKVLETRRELDRLIIRAATRRASGRERREIGAIGTQMLKAGKRDDAIGIIRLNDAMNQLAAQAAGNETAANAVAALHAVSRRFWYSHQASNPLTGETAGRHAAVAAAIARGDEEGAAAASDALIDHLFAFARATLAEG